MATYLQSWVDSSRDLPAELVRCFKLMQELDQRSHTLQQSVNQAAATQLEQVRLPRTPDPAFPQCQHHQTSNNEHFTSMDFTNLLRSEEACDIPHSSAT